MDLVTMVLTIGTLGGSGVLLAIYLVTRHQLHDRRRPDDPSLFSGRLPNLKAEFALETYDPEAAPLVGRMRRAFQWCVITGLFAVLLLLGLRG
jgi:hypothetical protein